MRRLIDFELRSDAQAIDLLQTEGLEHLVWTAHLVLAPRFLGLRDWTVTTLDVGLVRRATELFLRDAPTLTNQLMSELIGSSRGRTPTVALAADFAASVLLESSRGDPGRTLALELEDEFWRRRNPLYHLGAATSTLLSVIKGEFSPDQHRSTVCCLFAEFALEFVSSAPQFLNRMSLPSHDNSEDDAIGEVGSILEAEPTLSRRFELGQGTTGREVVRRALRIFNAARLGQAALQVPDCEAPKAQRDE